MPAFRRRCLMLLVCRRTWSEFAISWNDQGDPVAIQARVVAERKAQGLCIDCGKSAFDPKAGRVKVRCKVCRTSIATSRKLVLKKGLCSVCRVSPARPERTSCGPCGQRAYQNHKRFLAGLRKRACIAT